MNGDNDLRESIQEKLFERNKEGKIQGDLMKQLAASIERQNKDDNDLRVYAAMYYTDEKIEKIDEESKQLLHKIDIDTDEWKKKCKDISQLKVEDVEKLLDREDEIYNMQKKLMDIAQSSNNVPKQKSILINLIDFLSGGNNDEN